MQRRFYLIHAVFAAFALSTVCTRAAATEECRFNYWQIIPSGTGCESFILPDFTLREVPQAKDAPAHIRRFCKLYEIQAEKDRQEAGYCYTGEGDRTGPEFTVNGKKFLADLNFVGCLNGKKSAGIVFVPGGWEKAPPNLRRLWPVDSMPKSADCGP